MIKERLIKEYGKEVLYNSCLWYEHGETNLRYFLDKVKPVNCLEIGTMYGLATAVISEYCQKVYTLDVSDYMKKYEYWQHLGIKNIKSVLVNDNKGKIQAMHLIKECFNIDFVFIDGLHWYGQTEFDFELCKGIPNILFHDYNDVHCEVKDFINALDGEKQIKGNFVLYKEKI